MANRYSLKEAWPKLVAELLVVFIGVSLAFVLERWGETRREQQQEQLYLENVYKEVRDDNKSLKNVVDYYEKKTDMLKKILKNLEEKTHPEETKTMLEEGLLSNQLFRSSASTMESLKTSGELKLIRNFEVKTNISKLLRMHYFLDRIGQMQLEMMRDQILPYILKRVDITSKDQYKNLNLSDPYFINLISMYASITRDYTNTMTLTLKRAEILAQLLEKEYEFIQPPPDREEPKDPEPGPQ